MPISAKLITTRCGIVSKGDKWRCRFVARAFKHDDPDMERVPHFRQHDLDRQTAGHACGPARLFDLVLGCGGLILPRRTRLESFLLGVSRNGPRRYQRQRWTRGESLVEAEEAALQEKEGCEEVQSVCRDGSNRRCRALNNASEQPSLFRRPGTTLKIRTYTKTISTCQGATSNWHGSRNILARGLS